MKKSKFLIYVIAMCIWAYTQIRVGGGNDLIQIYDGVIFNSSIVHYVRWFYLLACYSLYIYNEFEAYIHQYGVILITRETSREKFFRHLVKRLIKLVLQIEGIKLGCCTAIMVIMKRGITISSPLEFFNSIFLNLVICFLFLFIQMIVEIWCSGNISVVITLVNFLIGFGISDFIDRSQFVSDKMNLLLIQNLTMRIRVVKLVENKYMTFIIIGGLMVSIGIIYTVAKMRFKEKDIL